VIHTLSIEFQGICAHFRGVVPGVPHRVVLPDASALRLGLVDVQGMPAPIPYALMPHIAGIVVDRPDLAHDPPKFFEAQSKFNIEDLMVLGAVVGGVRVQIVNASQTELQYHESYDDVPSIREFVPHRNFSADVVLGGRAALYFDFFAGDVRSETVGGPGGGAMRTIVTVETDGPPVLLITPFFPTEELGVPLITPSLPAQEPVAAGPQPMRSYLVALDEATQKLIVGNFDLIGFAPGFDYLWHFTVMQGGIPRKLATFPPGMQGAVWDETVLAAVLDGYARVLKLIEQAMAWWPLVILMGTEPSCSDSRFP
jgi:hypothetical protein